ncbi:type II secretion system protein [Alcanivorax nanhaiticus]|uniref:Type II secretion system protein n=1 Tax=Alcanivorax nanhaiticus TaxID=1177154 RepID=A0A095TQ49_9GAMM|nr:type II secretion system F family protein [Alcanivorax nanhaiticus]KGD64508.1 type II secretion system protein [Alcanivorax nanhaiticus]
MVFTANTIVISVISFLAVVGLIEGLYMMYRAMNVERTSAVGKRLQSLSAAGLSNEEALSLLRQREFSGIPIINRMLMAFPRSHSLDRALVQSGVDLSVSRYILVQMMLVTIFFILLLILGALWLVALPIALILGLFLPFAYVKGKTKERANAITDQLPDALDFLARSMRAGNPFSAAIKLASKEMGEPIAPEFAVTFDELNYGMDLEDALRHLADRSGSEEMRYFVTAVVIQRTTGGNLAEVLNRLSAVMRARARTFREIRVLAAEMKFSANVLMALPFFVAGAIAVLNPGYLDILFTHKLGYFIIGAQMLFMLTGYFVIQKMINFRV